MQIFRKIIHHLSLKSRIALVLLSYLSRFSQVEKFAQISDRKMRIFDEY